MRTRYPGPWTVGLVETRHGRGYGVRDARGKLLAFFRTGGALDQIGAMLAACRFAAVPVPVKVASRRPRRERHRGFDT